MIVLASDFLNFYNFIENTSDSLLKKIFNMRFFECLVERYRGRGYQFVPYHIFFIKYLRK